MTHRERASRWRTLLLTLVTSFGCFGCPAASPVEPVTSEEQAAQGIWLRDRLDLVRNWLKESGSTGPKSAQTPAYGDLTLAFGLARLGQRDASRKLLESAREALRDKDEAHQFLLAAYEHRINRALEGKPHSGPLPSRQIETYRRMDRIHAYVVDRLRKHSRILEPDQRINPYRHWGARINNFEGALAELPDLTDKGELVKRVDKLLAEVPEGAGGIEQRARILKVALETAPRVGEEFGKRLLAQALSVYDALPEAKEMAPLLEQADLLAKATSTAAYFGRAEDLRLFTARLRRLLATRKDRQALLALATGAEETLRSLRKLGLREEVEQLARQLTGLMAEEKEGEREIDPATLRLQLSAASAWGYLGREEQAGPILAAARKVLLAGELAPREQTLLACAYVKALGRGPVRVAQVRLEEVWKSLKGVRDTYTTSTHFSVSQLEVLEAAVLAVVGDE